MEFDIEGEWTRIAETWSEDKSSDTIFAIDLLIRNRYVILGNFLLNLSTTFYDAVIYFRHR